MMSFSWGAFSLTVMLPAAAFFGTAATVLSFCAWACRRYAKRCRDDLEGLCHEYGEIKLRLLSHLTRIDQRRLLWTDHSSYLDLRPDNHSSTNAMTPWIHLPLPLELLALRQFCLSHHHPPPPSASHHAAVERLESVRLLRRLEWLERELVQGYGISPFILHPVIRRFPATPNAMMMTTTNDDERTSLLRRSSASPASLRLAV